METNGIGASRPECHLPWELGTAGTGVSVPAIMSPFAWAIVKLLWHCHGAVAQIDILLRTCVRGRGVRAL